ncbi:putative cytidine/deoxycytidylate deaminase [Nitrospira sp. KM1]|uniref:nucleoside deaminase n=1 Tax=Nitrospira sp. KM1 TaxID=1936990 RepID=UPI0013A779FE|nr:nucleoside deaminase [Nitrospira sp. KM1]BCA53820.1 putative cytidine/deoxycytidylate deaminase [Nitrospira sp. KM1]
MNFIQRTIELARENVESGGRPFSCLIVKDTTVLAEGVNLVAQTRDPTAHAEICAIRKATATLHTEHLIGTEFYLLAHPCPMCLAAMYYCSPDRVVFITKREDYSGYYQDDRKYISFSSFYGEFAKPWNERRLPMTHQSDPDGISVYRRWQELNGKN